MPGEGRLMQRCRVRMKSRGVVPVGVFTRVKKHANKVSVAELGSGRQGTVPVVNGCIGKQAQEMLHAPEGCRYGQCERGSAGDEGLCRGKLSVADGRLQCSIGPGTAGAEKIDQRNLHAAFARNPARRHKAQRLLQRESIRAGIDEHFGNLDDIFGQAAAPNGILGDELNQRGIAEIVVAFKDDPLPHQRHMPAQIGSQSFGIAGIDQVDGVAKD